jgi:VWFA-related protein
MRQLRVTPSVVILASLAFVSSPAAAQLAVGEVVGERIDVNTVNVEVHVSDKSGRPVTGLQRGDFVLLEDGKPMEVANFDAAVHQAVASSSSPVLAGPGAPETATTAAQREPASWVLYVDDLYIRPASRARVLRQLRDFLTRDLVPGDRVMVVTYDRGLHIRLPFTDDRAALARALDAAELLNTGGGELAQARRMALATILEVLGVNSGMGGRTLNQAEKKEGRRVDPDEGGGGGGGGGPRNCPVDIAEPVKSYASAVRHEVLSSISALTVLVNSLSGVPGRKVLLHVSDGIPVTPGEELFQVLYQICGGGSANSGMQSSALPVFDGGGPGGGYKATQATLEAQTYSTAKEWTVFSAHANAQRVTLYTFQASGVEAAGMAADMGPGEEALSLPEVASIERSNRQEPLSVMASETGGRAIFWANDFRPDLARIQEDLATYYSLGFNPPHTGDGREHRIQVRVKRSGVTLRYRQSYRDKPSLERAVDRTLASLFYGYQDNPLDVRMTIGVATSGGPAGNAEKRAVWAVPVRLRIPLFKLGLQTRDDVYEGKLRLLVAVRDTEGANTPVRQIEVPIRIPHDQAITALGQSYLYEIKLSLKAGEQQLAIAVRDEATTTTSYLARTLRIGGAEKPAAR